MPLPFQLDHINLWVLEDGRGWTIADTGVGLPEVRGLWEQVFASYLGGRPVTRVVVTHFHPDHMGNAAWLVAQWPARLWCTQAEWLTAQLAWRSRDIEGRVAHYRRNGASDEALEMLRGRGNPYVRLVPTVTTEFVCLNDGDELTIGGRKWRVLTARGHSPEHACLVCEDDALLIAGDQVLPTITTNVSVWWEQPWGRPLDLYLASLNRFQGMPEETLVLPSHGLPFRGLRQRIAALREHHEARLAEALEALAEPRSAADIIPVLFRRALDAHQLAFAMGEALAHLHSLEGEGRVVRVLGEDGIHRFRRS